MSERPSRLPASTYRFQLNEQFPFGAALEQLEYLRLLGVSDVYLSPILAARPGSVHGYDVIDPAIVWSAVEVDLAPLMTDVQALLNSVG